jgi:hypothetical protein
MGQLTLNKDMKQIKIKSRWTTSASIVFEVSNVVNNEQGTWIHYVNVITGNTYNCLVDAFLQRFTETVNS